MNGSSVLLLYALIALGFYLLILRPQARRKKALASTQSTLEPGAEVMLTSGIFGTVVSLEDETVHLELASGAVAKVARQAIVRVVEPAPEGYVSDWDSDYDENEYEYDEDDDDEDQVEGQVQGEGQFEGELEDRVEDPSADVVHEDAGSGSTAVTLDKIPIDEDRPGTPDRTQ